MSQIYGRICHIKGGWSGGSRRARRGLCRAMGVASDSWATSGPVYKTWLFENGRELEGDGKMIRKGVVSGKADLVFSAKGKQPIYRDLLQRIVYFSTGLVIGSRSFVKGFTPG